MLFKKKPQIQATDTNVVVGVNSNNKRPNLSKKRSMLIAFIVVGLIAASGAAILVRKDVKNNSPSLPEISISSNPERVKELSAARELIDKSDSTKLNELAERVRSLTDPERDVDLQYIVFIVKYLEKDYLGAKTELEKLKTIRMNNQQQESLFVTTDTVIRYEGLIELKTINNQGGLDAKAE